MRREVVRAAILVFLVAPVVFVAGVLVISLDLAGVGGPDPEPPEGALVYGDRRVEPDWTTIGCWREARPYLPDNEACISSEAGIRPEGLPQGTPVVSRGATLRFTTGWPHVPKDIAARAVRTDVSPDDALAMEQDEGRAGGGPGVHYMPLGYEVLEVPVRREAEGAEFSADWAPGEYLVSLRMEVDDAEAVGEAYYDFEIVVEG